MNQPTTFAPDSAMDRNQDEAPAVTNTTQYERLEKPRSSAWLLDEILVVLLVLAFFVIILRSRAGIF